MESLARKLEQILSGKFFGMMSVMNSNDTKILLVEDSLSLAEIYSAYLERAGLRAHRSSKLADAVTVYETYAPDLVLIDLDSHDRSGLDFLQYLGKLKSSPEVVAITPTGSGGIATEAMQLGAIDFLAKPFDASRLIVTLNNVIIKIKLERKATHWDATERDGRSGLVGTSAVIQTIYKTIDALGASDAPVFITGESGTGKELTAEAIHRNSERKNCQFVTINCGAVSPRLIESELFGHVKGSLRGAIADRTGVAAAATGGTVFLDEICELDAGLQKKLLRFLQTGTYCKVGGSKIETANVRIICATSRDPLSEVREGRFREDLFYRIYVVPVRMPCLRERREDIVLIAENYLRTFARSESSQFSDISPAAKRALEEYIWPGNVRQLENILHQLVNRNEGHEIECSMLPSYICKSSLNGAIDVSMQKSSRQEWNTDQPETSVKPLWMIERDAIENAVVFCGGSINKAAGLLEVSPSTLYRKYQSWKRNHA